MKKTDITKNLLVAAAMASLVAGAVITADTAYAGEGTEKAGAQKCADGSCGDKAKDAKKKKKKKKGEMGKMGKEKSGNSKCADGSCGDKG